MLISHSYHACPRYSFFDPSRHPRRVIILAAALSSATCTNNPEIISIINRNFRRSRYIFNGNNNYRDETTVLYLVELAVGGTGMIREPSDRRTASCLDSNILLARRSCLQRNGVVPDSIVLAVIVRRPYTRILSYNGICRNNLHKKYRTSDVSFRLV